MTERELMLSSILNCRRVDLVANPKMLTLAQKSRYDRMKARREQGEPLQYVIGHCDFMGVPLLVDARGLIPRPETEILVEMAMEKIKAMLAGDKAWKVLDLGAGSGNITIALAKNISNITVTALDISEDALTLAAKNAKINGVTKKVKFLFNDMSTYLKNASGQGEKFDVVISNPPYIPTGQLARLPADVRCEPRLALDGGDDGLCFYEIIIQYGHQILKSNGFLLMEIGDGQRRSLETIFSQYPQYQQISFYKDYVGTDRIVAAQLKRSSPDARRTRSPEVNLSGMLGLGRRRSFN